MLINFGNGHSTVIGITQSGKTFATSKTLSQVKEGVIFFNTQLVPMPNNFITCSANDNIKSIINAVKQGRKLNYLPQLDGDIRNLELIYIINALYTRGNENKIYLVVDEIHLYTKDALKKAVQVATTGIRFGIYGIWISQRGANIDNTLMTQSNKFILFKTNMEAEYFKRYGIPGDVIKGKLESLGQYAYCEYDFHEVKGPYKV